MALAEVFDFQDYLQRDFGPSELGNAELVLDLASSLVEAYAGRSFTRGAATTETLTAHDRKVFLPSPPVSVSAVTLDGAPVDFEVWPNEGFVYVGVSDGTRVEVTYAAGMESVPVVAKAITLAVASRLLTNPDGVTQKSIGDVSISYGRAQSGPGLTEWEKQAAASLRVVGVS